MVKHRYSVSFFSTTLFYLLLVGAYFYVQTQYLVADQKPQDKVMHLSLATFVPEVIPPAEEPVEEEVIEEPEPEPIIKEKPIVEKVIPEPVVPKIIPKPVIKKVEKKPVVKS